MVAGWRAEESSTSRATGAIVRLFQPSERLDRLRMLGLEPHKAANDVERRDHTDRTSVAVNDHQVMHIGARQRASRLTDRLVHANRLRGFAHATVASIRVEQVPQRDDADRPAL